MPPAALILAALAILLLHVAQHTVQRLWRKPAPRPGGEALLPTILFLPLTVCSALAVADDSIIRVFGLFGASLSLWATTEFMTGRASNRTCSVWRRVWTDPWMRPLLVTGIWTGVGLGIAAATVVGQSTVLPWAHLAPWMLPACVIGAIGLMSLAKAVAARGTQARRSPLVGAVLTLAAAGVSLVIARTPGDSHSALDWYYAATIAASVGLLCLLGFSGPFARIGFSGGASVGVPCMLVWMLVSMSTGWVAAASLQDIATLPWVPLITATRTPIILGLTAVAVLIFGAFPLKRLPEMRPAAPRDSAADAAVITGLRHGDNADDLLGRMASVAAAVSLIRGSLPPHDAISVTGAYGSGKTWVLHHIEAQIAADYPTVWFDASKQDLSVSPIKSILGTARQTGGRATAIKYSSPEIAEVLLDCLAGWSLCVGAATATAGLSRTQGGGFIHAIRRHQEKHFQTREEPERLRTEFQAAMEQLSDLFADRSNLDSAESSRPVIVFIDDLDRCSPQEAAALLQRIRTILDTPACLFVIAVDEVALHRTLQDSVGVASPSDYLGKLMRNPLPPLVIDHEMRRTFVEGHLKNFMCDWVTDLSGLESIIQHLVAISDESGLNLRAMERIMTDMLVRFYQLKQVDDDNSSAHIRPQVVALISSLREISPSLFNGLSEASIAALFSAESDTRTSALGSENSEHSAPARGLKIPSQAWITWMKAIEPAPTADEISHCWRASSPRVKM